MVVTAFLGLLSYKLLLVKTYSLTNAILGKARCTQIVSYLARISKPAVQHGGFLGPVSSPVNNKVNTQSDGCSAYKYIVVSLQQD